ncbi:MAG: hypothetical protein K8R16_11920 [Anaerolineales bacterium]|nr:hypothetical protein [Anaerolineales bacterium]
MVIVIISTSASVGCGVGSGVSSGDGVGCGVDVLSNTPAGSKSSSCKDSVALDNGLAELETKPVLQADNPDRINKPITISFIINREETRRGVNISEKTNT